MSAIGGVADPQELGFDVGSVAGTAVGNENIIGQQWFRFVRRLPYT